MQYTQSWLGIRADERSRGVPWTRVSPCLVDKWKESREWDWCLDSNPRRITLDSSLPSLIMKRGLIQKYRKSPRTREAAFLASSDSSCIPFPYLGTMGFRHAVDRPFSPLPTSVRPCLPAVASPNTSCIPLPCLDTRGLLHVGSTQVTPES